MGAKKNKKLAKEVNVYGTKYLVKESEKLNSKFVYISTDYVFDGERGMYKESDTPSPLNFYGRTKLKGEKITSSLNKYLICRLSALFGLQPFNRLNFATWILKKLEKHIWAI